MRLLIALATLAALACAGSPSEPAAVMLEGTIRGGETVVAFWSTEACGAVPGDWERAIEGEVERGVAKAVSDDGVGPALAGAVSFDGFSFSFGEAARGSTCGRIFPESRAIQTACNCGRPAHRFIGWEARNWVCWVTRECVAI